MDYYSSCYATFLGIQLWNKDVPAHQLVCTEYSELCINHEIPWPSVFAVSDIRTKLCTKSALMLSDSFLLSSHTFRVFGPTAQKKVLVALGLIVFFKCINCIKCCVLLFSYSKVLVGSGLKVGIRTRHTVGPFTPKVQSSDALMKSTFLWAQFLLQ